MMSIRAPIAAEEGVIVKLDVCVKAEVKIRNLCGH